MFGSNQVWLHDPNCKYSTPRQDKHKHNSPLPSLHNVSYGGILYQQTIKDFHLWICIFQALEDYLWQSSDLLDRLEDMREDLNHNDFADDVAGAKKGLDLHTEVKKKIHKIPVESIDSMGQRLLQR